MAIDFSKSTKAITDNLPDNNNQLITANKLRSTLNTMIDDTKASIGSDVTPVISEMQGDISTLKTNYTDLKTDVDLQYNVSTTHSQEIEQLQGEMKSADDEIDKLWADNIDTKDVIGTGSTTLTASMIRPLLLTMEVDGMIRNEAKFEVNENYNKFMNNYASSNPVSPKYMNIWVYIRTRGSFGDGYFQATMVKNGSFAVGSYMGHTIFENFQADGTCTYTGGGIYN